MGNSWLVNSNFTLDDLHRNVTLEAEMLQLWKINGTGLIGSPPANQWGWFQADSSTFSSLGVPNPSAGPTSANFEMILTVKLTHFASFCIRIDIAVQDNFASKRIALPSTGRFFTMITNVISPTSRM